MQSAFKTGVAITVVGTAIMFLLTFAMNSLPTAQATPQIAQGKPCTECHTGTPPNKSNLKK